MDEQRHDEQGASWRCRGIEAGRALNFAGKLSVRVLEVSLEAAINGILRAISPERLGFMIDNGFLLVESTFYAIRNPPIEHYKNMSPEEVIRVERVRLTGERVGLPLLGMMRMVASRFPYRTVEEKVRPEWMMRRGREKFPQLVEVIESKGEAGSRWLEKQCREVVQFATGRIVWNDEQKTMIPAIPGWEPPKT